MLLIIFHIINTAIQNYINETVFYLLILPLLLPLNSNSKHWRLIQVNYVFFGTVHHDFNVNKSVIISVWLSINYNHVWFCQMTGFKMTSGKPFSCWSCSLLALPYQNHGALKHHPSQKPPPFLTGETRVMGYIPFEEQPDGPASIKLSILTHTHNSLMVKQSHYLQQTASPFCWYFVTLGLLGRLG